MRVSERCGSAGLPTGADTRAAAIAARQAPLFAAFDPARAPVASFVVPAALLFATVLIGRGILLPGTGLSICWVSVGLAFLLSLGHQSCSGPRQPQRISLWVVTLLASQAAGHAAAVVLWPQDGAAWSAVALWVLGDTIQALFGACLFKRLRRGRSLWGLDSLRTSMSLLAAASSSSLLSAAVIAVSVAVTGALPWAALPFIVLRNTLVIYGLAGCVILFSAPPDPDDVPRRDWRLTLAVCGGLAADLLFIGASGPQYSFAFVVVPIVMWAASVLSVRQTSIFLQIVTLPVMVASTAGSGPFVAGTPGARVAMTYGLVLFVCVMAMMLSLGTLERRRLLARVRAQAQQSADQARLLGAVLDAMPEAVVVVDAQGRVARQNIASRYLWEAGPRLVDLSGEGGHRPVRAALAGDDVGGVDVVIEPRTATAGTVGPVVVETGDAGCAERVVSVQAYPLRLADNPAAVVIAADVTEQRRRTDELRSFARVVAHDLFNPLAASDLWRETLQQELETLHPGLGAAQIGELAAANERMRAFITDLLNYTVTRDGALDRQDVELSELVESVAEDRLRAVPPDERPHLEVSLTGWVRGDRSLLRQLFVNLLDNAYKFRRPGTRGRIRVWTQTPHPAWLVVHVDDDGIGIPAGSERCIFQEFYRAEVGTSVRGSGLGLAICERIVARHGGRIEARLRGERGSRFTVWLPRLDVEPTVPAPAPPRGRSTGAAGEVPEIHEVPPAGDPLRQEALAAGPGGSSHLP